jgi:DNA repair exonuclease SbcCD ATPase subunit
MNACLRELWIDGFGCLRADRQPFRFDPQRLTLFVDENEAGKTTLQMAILASLYGIETDRRVLRSQDAYQLPRPHAAHWEPINGQAFGTRLRLHDGARLLEIRWDFARGDGCRVIDLDANHDVTADLCPEGDGRRLGERLLGLTIEEFIKTCFIRQDDLPRVADAEGLDILVQRTAASSSSDTTVGQAIERLEGLLRSYPGTMLKDRGLVDNEIRRLEEDIANIRGRLDQLHSERQEIAEEDAEFQRLASRRKTLREDVAHLEYLAQAAEHEELRESIEAARADHERLQDLQAEREELEHLADFPADRADQLAEWEMTRRNLLRLAEEKEQSVLDRQRQDLEPARRQLDELGPLAQATEEDAGRIERLFGKAQDLEAREHEHQQAVEREKAKLEAQGASVEELDRLEERFGVIEPEDLEFLDRRERLDAQAATDLEKSERDALELQVRMDRVQDARQREREAARRTVLIAASVAGAGLVIGTLLLLLLPAVGVGVLVAGLAGGAWLYLASQRRAAAAETLQADELAEARRALQDIDRRREELAEERRRRKGHLKGLAHAFGYEQPEVLLEDIQALEELRKLSAPLVQLRSQAEGSHGLAQQRQSLESDADALFADYGLERPAGRSLSEALEELRGRMANAARLRQKVHHLSLALDEDRAECEQKRQAAQDLTERIRQALADAGIETDGPVQKAIEEFQRRRKQWERLHQLTDELLPDLEDRAVAPPTLATWEADAGRLQRAVNTQREERPELLTLQVEERSQEYRRQLQEKREQLDTCDEEADQIGKHILGILERAHTEQPELEAALAEREAALERARRHKAALELAVGVLRDIGHQVHGQWAEELNRTTGQYLQKMAPRLRQFKFDPALRFGVWAHGAQEPTRSEERTPALSAGTWDQLFLAVRLSLAEFIARRGPGGLLILDDPFSHFDDRRFERAMHLLADLTGENHQGMLFSCQRHRFEWLEEQDSQWFRENIVRRSITALLNT